MSAELLREAASLMRARAEAAGMVTLDRPWASDGGQVTGGDGHWMLVATTTDAPPDDDFNNPIAEHIAGMDPTVALAVAAWLDHADRWVEGHPDSFPPWVKHAESVATAYLGQSS